MIVPERMWRNVWHSIASLALLVALFTCAQAAGQDPLETPEDPRGVNSSEPKIEELRVGFAGRYKVGYWAPAEVTITAGQAPFDGHLVVVAPDNDGIPTRVSAPAAGNVKLAAGESAQVPIYFKQGQLGGEIGVELHDASGRRQARVFRPGPAGQLAGVMPSGASLILSIGDQSARASESDKQASLTQLASFSALPAEWYGLEGVDAIVLHTSDRRMVEQLASDERQRTALDLWIRMGGRLILSVGRSGQELLEAEGPLADFAPGSFQALVPLRQGTVIEAYAETADPLDTGAGVELQIAQLANVRGQIESFAGSGPNDLPLVIRTPRGFGEIVCVAFDLDLEPIAGWKARPQLLARLLDRKLDSATGSQRNADTLGAVTTLGFVDLAGQLRGALDQFPGVPLVPFWLVAILVAAYIACIGPVDYYLVRHLLRRPEATWVSFTCTVLVFAAGAAGLAYSLKGRELRVNQLDIVDFDTESGFARRTSFANVFSPEIATYDLTFEPRTLPSVAATTQSPAPGALFSWFGLSGTGFGGMDAAAGAGGGIGAASSNLPLFSVGYQYSRALDQLHGVPIAVWSSKAFVGRGWSESAGGIESQLADDGRLTGTVRNSLPAALTHCVLIYDKWAYVIRDFPAGREIDLEIDIDPQTVDTYLRKVTAVGDRKVAAPYDQAGLDVPRIVEVMTAHDLVGGKSYTGLVNQYQQFLELSSLVDRGRAVLIGRASEPAATLVNASGDSPTEPLAGEERTQHWTFHRYVLPVAKK